MDVFYKWIYIYIDIDRQIDRQIDRYIDRQIYAIMNIYIYGNHENEKKFLLKRFGRKPSTVKIFCFDTHLNFF